MLMQVTFENILSFHQETTFSFLAADNIEHDERLLLRQEGCPPLLRVAAIYGANASGKSNFSRAFHDINDLISAGVRPGQRNQIIPFLLDEDAVLQPSRAEFELFVGGRHYSYGIVVTRQHILEEWLLVVPSAEAEPELLFHRVGKGPDASPEFELKSSFDSDFYQFLARGTRAAQPFLAELREKDDVIVRDLIRWFADEYYDVFHQDREDKQFFSAFTRQLDTAPAFKRFTTVLLRGAGTGVSGLEFGEPLDDSSNLSAYARSVSLKVQPSSRELRLIHSGQPIPLALESDGTVRLLQLALDLFQFLEQGDVSPLMVIDEIDRSLHTLLSKHIIETFLDGGPTGQLIFTTHDTNLLDSRLLSRDCIWFTEKDARGASHMYSLAEYKADQLNAMSEEIEQGYLRGRFGAIPFLSTPGRLAWEVGEE